MVDPIAHACELRGYLTLDVRVDVEGNPFVIDVNANPGLSADGQIWRHPSFEYNLRQIVLSALAGPRSRAPVAQK
jgi:D-alanine-D-alanine ligase-like ATP-grasp enzyme